MSRKGNKSAAQASVDREQKILGVLLISLSLLVALGLVQNGQGALDGSEARRINRFVSHGLTSFLGLGAWVIPFLLIRLGWNRLAGASWRDLLHVLLVAAAGLITFSLLSFSTGLLQTQESRLFFGGNLGETLFSVANQNFGAIGSTLIAFTFFFVVLIWVYDIAIPRLNADEWGAAIRRMPGVAWAAARRGWTGLTTFFAGVAEAVQERLFGVEEEEDEAYEYEEGDEDEDGEEYEDGEEAGLEEDGLEEDELEEDEDEEDDEEDDYEEEDAADEDEEATEVADVPVAILAGDDGQPQIVKPALTELKTTSKLVRRPLTPKGEKQYLFPPLDLLADPAENEPTISEEYLLEQSDRLEKRLLEFGVKAKVIEVHPGPVITRFELEPGPGVKVQQISNLSDDLALVMRAKRIRIVAPIPGKGAVGIEIPNPKTRTVYLKEILTSKHYAERTSKLAIVLGKDISGRPMVSSLEDMPHLLIAGATGAGKSVCIHAVLSSLLFGAAPEEVHLMMIDPKMLEMTMYNGIPHLIHPVVTDPREAAAVLRWAVGEMERRYKLLAKLGVRNIRDYNGNLDKLRKSVEVMDEGLTLEPLPYIVIVIDEFADLILTAPSEIEDSVARLAQMARAIGIHLVLATQRPSVNVITGVIKANFPSRIAFQVASKIDSRTILDANGAEKLLGKGDMLFVFAGRPEVHRIHGAFVTTEETNELVMFLKEQGYTPKNRRTLDLEEETGPHTKNADGNTPFEDDLFDDAARIVIRSGQGSVSLLQRRLRVGYSRAARLVDLLEQAGIVGPFEGSKAREVLVDEEWLRLREQENLEDTGDKLGDLL